MSKTVSQQQIEDARADMRKRETAMRRDAARMDEIEARLIGWQLRESHHGAVEIISAAVEAAILCPIEIAFAGADIQSVQRAILKAAGLGFEVSPKAIAEAAGVLFDDLRLVALGAPAVASRDDLQRQVDSSVNELKYWRGRGRARNLAAQIVEEIREHDEFPSDLVDELKEISTSLERRAERPAGIVATLFSWRDPAEIPRRQWIFGRHAARRYVSATGADGGVGKTALALAECISVVTGRPLLNDGKVQQAACWYLGLEDDPEEYERRIAATVLAHHLDPDELDGGFFWDSGRKQNFVIATESRDGLQIVEPVVDGIIRRIREHNIGLLTVDPFVSSHEVSEQDNTKINFVMRQWAQIAHETGAAVELIHHTKKGAGQNGEAVADDLRGASALVRAARSVRILSQMTKDEAARAGVDNRKRFFRVQAGAKANMALHGDDGTWRELVSIDLRNGDELHPADNVQAAMAWRYPDASDVADAEQIDLIKAKIAAGEWRADVQAKAWAGNAVADVLGLDLADPAAKESVKRALRGWVTDGTFKISERMDAKRRPKSFVVIGPNS